MKIHVIAESITFLIVLTFSASCPACNQVGEAVGRIFLNIAEEDVEAYRLAHPQFPATVANRMRRLPLAANQVQDVFDFPRFEVRMIVSEAGIRFTQIPPQDEDEYVTDYGFDAPDEVDWAIPHMDLRLRVNEQAMEISQYNDDDSSHEESGMESSDDETSEEESSEENQ